MRRSRPKRRVERQAGESKVGCGCSHLAVTAAGNAVCRAFFGGFQPFYEQSLWVGCDLPFFRKVGCTSPWMPHFAHFMGCDIPVQIKQLQDQLVFQASQEVETKSTTFRQGVFMPKWWKVAPVMAAGEREILWNGSIRGSCQPLPSV